MLTFIFSIIKNVPKLHCTELKMCLFRLNHKLPKRFLLKEINVCFFVVAILSFLIWKLAFKQHTYTQKWDSEIEGGNCTLSTQLENKEQTTDLGPGLSGSLCLGSHGSLQLDGQPHVLAANQINHQLPLCAHSHLHPIAGVQLGQRTYHHTMLEPSKTVGQLQISHWTGRLYIIPLAASVCLKA